MKERDLLRVTVLGNEEIETIAVVLSIPTGSEPCIDMSGGPVLQHRNGDPTTPFFGAFKPCIASSLV